MARGERAPGSKAKCSASYTFPENYKFMGDLFNFAPKR